MQAQLLPHTRVGQEMHMDHQEPKTAAAPFYFQISYKKIFSMVHSNPKPTGKRILGNVVGHIT